MKYGRMPTIPEYYKDFINKDVDLDSSPSQCCPFHKEKTPSFSYSKVHKKWRCFGECHRGGSVVTLHMMNYKLDSEKEAEASLRELYCVEEPEFQFSNDDTDVNEDRVRFNNALQVANIYANRKERWLELDYVMSKYPVDIVELEQLVTKWRSGDKI